MAMQLKLAVARAQLAFNITPLNKMPERHF